MTLAEAPRRRRPTLHVVGLVVVLAAVVVGAAASGPRQPVPANTTRLAGVGSLSGTGDLVIGSMRMMSTSVGWALGGQAGQAAVLRTTDGGVTWADVSPNSNIGHGFSLFHFIGPDRAWLGLPGIAGDQRTLTVYRTDDAGKSWMKGETIGLPNTYPDAAPLPPGLQFVDLQHGWLTLGFQAVDPSSSGIGIYATSDGGMHWRQVSLTLDVGGSTLPNRLPIGCQKTGIVFNTSTRGWATGHCSDGSLFFYTTADGGTSWHARSLPAPAGYPATLFGNCNCGNVPPIFATPSDGALMFHSPDLLYVTHDAGDTWVPVRLPETHVALAQLIDAQQGWLSALTADPTTHALRFNRLYHSADGGLSWKAIIPNHELAGDLQFLADGTGWLIDHHAQTPELYKTLDGGATWRRVTPRLIGARSQSA